MLYPDMQKSMWSAPSFPLYENLRPSLGLQEAPPVFWDWNPRYCKDTNNQTLCLGKCQCCLKDQSNVLHRLEMWDIHFDTLLLPRLDLQSFRNSCVGWSSGGHRWERLFSIKGLTVKLVLCLVFMKCCISTNVPAVWAVASNLWC